MDKTLKTYLDFHSIHFIKHTHSAVYTVEESKSLKSEIPGLHCKCLFLKSDSKKYYLVALPAEKRLNIKSLEQELHHKKISFASKEELKKYLKISPGSVSIFCMINSNNVTLILDKEIWTAPIVGFHPNINTSTLELTKENLEKYYNSLKQSKCIMKL